MVKAGLWIGVYLGLLALIVTTVLRKWWNKWRERGPGTQRHGPENGQIGI
jgi:hypothetical protein